MALIKTLKGIAPKIGKDCFLADKKLIEGQINRIANSYSMYASWYRE